MNSILLKLKLITNLHAGNGDVNYNIIDNEVERDVTTGLPTIHSSGVKGAFREYLKKNSLKKNGETEDTINKLFGAGKTQGSLKFLSADLLGLAARASNGKESFYLVTEKSLLDLLKEKSNILGMELTETEQPNTDSCAAVDGCRLEKSVSCAGETIYLFTNDMGIRKISLPVIARNCLDDGGISKNLWYEEVVPHQSVFIVAVLSDSEDDLKTFRTAVENKFVQFGGNASIGYGICKVTVVGIGGNV